MGWHWARRLEAELVLVWNYHKNYLFKILMRPSADSNNVKESASMDLTVFRSRLSRRSPELVGKTNKPLKELVATKEGTKFLHTLFLVGTILLTVTSHYIPSTWSL